MFPVGDIFSEYINAIFLNRGRDIKFNKTQVVKFIFSYNLIHSNLHLCVNKQNSETRGRGRTHTHKQMPPVGTHTYTTHTVNATTARAESELLHIRFVLLLHFTFTTITARFCQYILFYS